jgi:hypothetical protein
VTFFGVNSETLSDVVADKAYSDLRTEKGPSSGNDFTDFSRIGFTVTTCVEIKILRRVLNRRVDLHAIDATPPRWRGDAGSSPLDRARTAAPDALVDLHTGHDQGGREGFRVC